MNAIGNGSLENGKRENRASRLPAGLKEKDLIGIPWRVALALQEAGWYLRTDIIWHKPNPMPESVTDRPTKSHEYIFLLTKSERYFYDAEAITEECSPNTHARIAQNLADQVGSDRANGGMKTNGKMKAVFKGSKTGENADGVKNNQSFAAGTCLKVIRRNKRTVWTVPTNGYKGAHFATFPPELIKPCILAGTSEKGCCPQCGAPWVRIVERVKSANPASFNGGNFQTAKKKAVNDGDFMPANGEGLRTESVKTTGWKPTCECGAEESAIVPVPCTVLDPFGGSGTTGAVSLELGRAAILCELNDEYLPLIQQRTDVTPGLCLA